jgi:hypothetical protein
MRLLLAFVLSTYAMSVLAEPLPPAPKPVAPSAKVEVISAPIGREAGQTGPEAS